VQPDRRTGCVNHDDCARLAALAPSAALGALEPDDAAFVRAHLSACPRAHPELRDALALAAVIGEAMPDEDLPSPALRERLMARIHEESPDPTAVAAVVRQPAPPWRWIASGAGVLAAAAVLAVAVLAGQVGALRAELDAAERDLVARTAELDQAQAWIQRAVASGATAFFMDGEGQGEFASFMLVVEDDAAGAVLLMSGLPQLAEGETYELWVERDGRVIGVGTFTPDREGLAALAIDASVAGVRQAMITIEPEGGSTQPNADDVIMQGELST
jgi:hypothetical protein